MAFSPPLPHPGRDPAEVVRLVLDALRRHDHSDIGIDTLIAFASPVMMQRIGDRAAVERALGNTRYAPLLGHREVISEPLQQLGGSARQLVQVVAADGEEISYLFALARQSRGEAKGCWLLSGLMREGAI